MFIPDGDGTVNVESSGRFGVGGTGGRVVSCRATGDASLCGVCAARRVAVLATITQSVKPVRSITRLRSMEAASTPPLRQRCDGPGTEFPDHDTQARNGATVLTGPMIVSTLSWPAELLFEGSDQRRRSHLGHGPQFGHGARKRFQAARSFQPHEVEALARWHRLSTDDCAVDRVDRRLPVGLRRGRLEAHNNHVSVVVVCRASVAGKVRRRVDPCWHGVRNGWRYARPLRWGIGRQAVVRSSGEVFERFRGEAEFYRRRRRRDGSALTAPRGAARSHRPSHTQDKTGLAEGDSGRERRLHSYCRGPAMKPTNNSVPVFSSRSANRKERSPKNLIGGGPAEVKTTSNANAVTAVASVPFSSTSRYTCCAASEIRKRVHAPTCKPLDKGGQGGGRSGRGTTSPPKSARAESKRIPMSRAVKAGRRFVAWVTCNRGRRIWTLLVSLRGLGIGHPVFSKSSSRVAAFTPESGNTMYSADSPAMYGTRTA